MIRGECLSSSVSQIDYLISVLNKRNNKAAYSEINKICAQNSGSVEHILLRCLFFNIDFSNCDAKKLSKDSPLLFHLIEELRKFITKPNFNSLICYAIQSSFRNFKDSNQFSIGASSASQKHDRHALISFLEKLIESLPQTTGLSAGLSLSRSTNAVLRQSFSIWFRSKFTSYSENESTSSKKDRGEILAKLGAGLFQELGIERFHFMLVQLRLSSDPHLSSSKFIRALRRGAKGASALPIALTSLSSSSEETASDSPDDEENSSIEKFFLTPSNQLKALTGSPSDAKDQLTVDHLLADAFEDLGGVSLSTCQAAECLLSQFSSVDVTPVFVARSLCVMIGPTPEAKSPLSSEQFVHFLRSIGKTFPENFAVDKGVDVWPVENFLDWVHRMNADLSVSQMIDALDCSTFYVADQAGLAVLKRFIVYETHLQQQVPLELFYRPWNNVSGQLSLFQQCILYPDLNILLSNKPTPHLTGLKLVTGEDKIPAIQIWKSPDFIEALFRISTAGFFNEARVLLEQGFSQSPDIFTATLLATSGMVPLKQEMLAQTLSRLLLPHTNSHVILQTVWTGLLPHLTDSERRLQRSLLLHRCMKLVESWCEDCSPPPSSNSLISTPQQATFFNFLSVLLRLQGDPIIPMALLLGTRTRLVSKAVFQLWPMRSTSDVSFLDASELAEIVNWPSVCARLDLAITLVVYMVEAVNNLVENGDLNAEPCLLNLRNRPISTIQNTLDSFLAIWCAEQMSGIKEDADLFAHELRTYLARRYPALADNGAPLFSPQLEVNYHLPKRLRKPPTFLLRHIINSAFKAISEGSTSVSPRVQAETVQALDYYLQNLNRAYAQSNPTCAPNLQNVAANSLPQTVPATWNTRDPNLSNIAFSNGNYNQLPAVRSSAPLMAATVGGGGSGGGGGGAPHSSSVLPALICLDFNVDLMDADPTPEDRQVNGFFHSLLQSSTSVEESVKILYDYASCDDVPSRKLLEGILRVLTAEITLHFLDYPEHALNSIMNFYGGVLAGLVNQLPVPILSSLWKALLGRLYQFTSEASLDTPAFRSILSVLYKTKSTFVRYANLTTALIGCQMFKHFPLDLRETILNADAFCKSYQRPAANVHPHLTGSQSLKDLQVSGQTMLLQQPQQTQPQLSEWAPPTPPEESIRDRIVFIVNNVDRANIRNKCNELCDVLKSSMLPWFIYYLINKRVTVENVFLDVFADVIDQVNQRLPTTRVLAIEELYRAIKAILRSIRSDVDDAQTRGYLKNLGRFLGMLTLARNQAILHEDLNLKELVLEAEEMGPVAFAYVIPFVSQVLKGAVDTVFAPPTPYTVAILRVLRELYEGCNMKVQFKFEIELIFKDFGMSVYDVPPPENTRNRGTLPNIEKRYISYANPSTGNAPVTTAQHQVTNQPSATQTRSIIAQQVSQAQHQQQPSLSYDSPGIECNPRSLAALAQQQHQRLAAAVAVQHQQQQSQHQPLYGNVSSASGRSNVFAAFLEGAQSNPAAAAAVLAGNVHRGGDSIYSYAAAAAADDNFRRKFDPSFLSLQQQPTQQQASQSSSRQQQVAIYQQLSNAVTSQQIAGGQNSTYSASAAGLSHVVSAPQLASSGQQGGRDMTQSASLFHYEEVDINTVRAAVNMEDIVHYLYNLSNSPVSAINSAPANRAFNIIHIESMKAAIMQAIEKSIANVINVHAERSISIAVATTDTIVRKDYAFQPDSLAMMRSARQMVRHMACSYTLGGVRESLQPAMLSSIIATITGLTKFDKLDKDASELIAMVITTRVLPAGVAYIQKTIAERAIREIEKKLEPEVKLRQELGPRRFAEQAARLHKNLPESVQLNAHMTNVRPQAYNEFDRAIPGFAPLSTYSMSSTNSHFVMQSTSGNPALAAAQQQILQRAVSSSVMPPQQGQQQSQVANVSTASSMAKYIQQQHQYLQQQQQHTGAAIASSQPSQSQVQASGSSGDAFYSLALLIRRQIENLAKLMQVTPPSDSPILRALQEIMEIVVQARSQTSVQNSNIFARLVSATVHSFLSFYRPSQSEGQQVMEYFREIHLVIFKTLLSVEQPSWIIRQITHAWIKLPDGEPFVESPHTPTATDANNPPSKVEQLSTLATLAVAKSGTQVPDSSKQTELNTCKWNWEAFAELLRFHVLYLSQIDACLAPKVEAGHKLAVKFVLNLLDQYVLPTFAGSSYNLPAELGQLGINATQTVSTSLGNIFKVAHKREFTVLNEFDLWLTMRALERLQLSTLITPGDFNLRLRLTCARIRALMDWGLIDNEELNVLASKDSSEFGALFAGISRTLEFDDSVLMKTRTENVFRCWCYQRPQPAPGQPDFENHANQLLGLLHSYNLITNDENVTRFFRLATIFVIDRAQNTLKTVEVNNPSSSNPLRNITTLTELDAYASLIAIVIGLGFHEGGEKSKITLLNRVLGILGGTLMQSHEVRTENFNSMPFERILIMLLGELYDIVPPSTRSSANKSEEGDDQPSTNLTLYEYIPIAFGSLLHLLRPARMPRFQLAFLEIISHRSFMERMLGKTEPELISAPLRTAYRAIYAQLLADMMSHIAFFLQNTITSKTITNLYVSTFRLWMVLFYDFPDFLSEYCLFFCNIFPSAAIQLRNLVISTEPRKGANSTDPLNAPPVDQLNQLEDPVGYTMKAGNRLPPVLRAEVDSYLNTRSPSKLLADLQLMLRRVDSVAALLICPSPLLTSALFVEQSEGGEGACGQESTPPQPPPQGKKAKKAAAAKAAAAAAHQQAILSGAAVQANMSTYWAAVGSQTLATYGLNTCLHYIPELVTDLVVYLCITAVRNLREAGMPLNVSTVAKTPQMEILQALLLSLDDGGRYLLLNCMANQLRYLNSHTCYFSYSLLYLFSEIPSEKAKEQISRVLMERLIVNRPHPWGLLMTSAELLRNPIYNYWNHDFARCHKDMEEIVTVVARSCIPNFTPPQSGSVPTATTNQQPNATSASLLHMSTSGAPNPSTSETKAGVAATANLS